MTATEARDKSNEVKTSRLLTAVGEKARHVYYTFTFDNEEDSMKLDVVLKKFDEYMSPKKNLTYMNYRFFAYNQDEGQSIDESITELKSRSEHCEFGDLKNSLIRDKIGVSSRKVQERLLRETELSLGKAIQVCRAAENVKMQTKEMKGLLKLGTNIDLVNKKSSSDNTRSSSTGSIRKGIQNRREMVKDCKYCGNEHQYVKCPAFKRLCKKCNKLSHFASDCRSRPVSQETKQNNFSSSNSDEDDESSLKLSGVNGNNRKDTSAQPKPRVCTNLQEESEQFFINSVEPCRSTESDRYSQC